jgi:hypothetical protein
VQYGLDNAKTNIKMRNLWPITAYRKSAAYALLFSTHQGSHLMFDFRLYSCCGRRAQ